MTRKEGVAYGLLSLACLLAAGRVFLVKSVEGTEAHYVKHCEEAGGEWVHGAAEPTCLRADGLKMFFDQQAHGFQLHAAVAGTSTPEPVVSSTATEIDCANINTDFSAYPATEPELKRSVAADFATAPAALHHRTAITKDIARGVNFAGHYVLAEWGCGTNCYGMAVVDASTGAIQGYGTTSTQLFSYQKNSRLIGSNTEHGLVYFVVDQAGELIEVCSR